MTRLPHFSRAMAVVAFASLAGSLVVAADWTRWLGPEQTGASPEEGIFGKARPVLNVAWSRPLGVAYSGIAVAGDRVVTMFGDGKVDWLVALEAKNGEELWRYRIDEMFPKTGGADGGPLSMPVIDGKIAYGLGARGQLFAVSLGSGSEIWKIRIDEKLGAIQPHFGFTTSPLVVGELLFVQTGGKESRGLTALDKMTGKLMWSLGDERVGYQSPVLVEIAGSRQIIAVTNSSVVGLRPEDGTVLWRASHELTEADGFSTAIMTGEATFLLTGREESAVYRVSKTGSAFEISELWRATSLKGNFAMPVVLDRQIYGFNGDFLTCVDATTGEQRWKARQDGAGIVLVDGHLVIYAGSGDVLVAEASPEAFKEVVRVKVTEGAGYTYPSFADGAIYVRDLESIARINIGER